MKVEMSGNGFCWRFIHKGRLYGADFNFKDELESREDVEVAVHQFKSSLQKVVLGKTDEECQVEEAQARVG